MYPVQLSVEELIAELSERLRNEDAVERKKSKLELEIAGLKEEVRKLKAELKEKDAAKELEVRKLKAELKEKDAASRIYADKIKDIRRDFLASPPNETLKKLDDIAKGMTLHMCESSSPDHTRPQTAPPFTRRTPEQVSSSGSDGDVETTSDSCWALPVKHKRPPQQANTDVDSGHEELVLPRLS